MFKLIAFGDVILRSSIGGDPFEEAEEIFNKYDFVLFNLETPILIKGKSYPPSEKSFRFAVNSTELLWLDKYKNKIIFSLANNHILDYGTDGYKDTLIYLEENKIRYCAQSRPLLVEHDGIKISIYAHYYENGIKPALLRQNDDSIKIMSIHWGAENILLPTFDQANLAKELFAQGYDIILGHHSHTPQKIYIANNKACAFSLGNCNMFNNDSVSKRATRIGQGLEIIINSDKAAQYRRIPVFIDSDFKPLLLQDELVYKYFDRIDSLFNFENIGFAYKFKYNIHFSMVNIVDNMRLGWLPRIKKYGVSHLLEMLKWCLQKSTIISFILLSVYPFSKASKLIKEINAEEYFIRLNGRHRR